MVVSGREVVTQCTIDGYVHKCLILQKALHDYADRNIRYVLKLIDFNSHLSLNDNTSMFFCLNVKLKISRYLTFGKIN